MPKKLLLADDSITIQKVVGITLANEDLEITSVDNGEDAVTRARQIRPDLVLADASMPRRDGYQVAEALKGDPSTASIPVLILAGQLEGHPDQARLTACRADGFIPKPFQSQELIDRVRKILGLAGPVAVSVPSAARPAGPGAPVATPRPAPPAAPAPRTTPMAPMSQTVRSAQPPLGGGAPAMATARPAPIPAPAPKAPAPTPKSTETDFSDLAAAPAASGDQDLWGDAPVGGQQQISAESDLWGGGNGAGAATSAPGPEIVTNAAELANLERFDAPDSAPSGLDLDTPAPRTATGAPVDAAMLAEAVRALPPEKLEAIVREAAREILKPIIEKIAWEVVPDLAEDIIKDELKRLTN